MQQFQWNMSYLDSRRENWNEKTSKSSTADRVAKNLEIISKNFLFSTRRTRIPTGFIISTRSYLIGTRKRDTRGGPRVLAQYADTRQLANVSTY